MILSPLELKSLSCYFVNITHHIIHYYICLTGRVYESRLQWQVRVQFKLGHPVLPRHHLLLLRVDVEVEDDAVGRELDRLVLVQPPLGELRPVFIVFSFSLI